MPFEIRGLITESSPCLLLNFDAMDYVSLIDLMTYTESPLTQALDEGELQCLVDFPFIKSFLYHCDTQAVERLIRVVTELSTQVLGYKAPDGLVRSRLAGP